MCCFYMYLQGIKDNDIHNIVLSYLVHNCYRETLESFVDCTGMPEPADYIEDMEKRKGMQIFSVFDRKVGFVTLKHDHLLFSMFSVTMLVALKF